MSSLSDRDLLIKLSTEVDYIKKMVVDIKARTDRRDSSMTKLQERVTINEQQTQENTKLRNWVYVALLSSFLQFLLNGLGLLGIGN